MIRSIAHPSCLPNHSYVNGTAKFGCQLGTDSLPLGHSTSSFCASKQLLSRSKKKPFRLFSQIRGFAGLGVAMWAPFQPFQCLTRVPVDGVISLIITGSFLKCDFPIILNVLVTFSSPSCIYFHFFLTHLLLFFFH